MSKATVKQTGAKRDVPVKDDQRVEARIIRDMGGSTTTLHRATGEVVRRVTVYLPASLHKQAKLFALVTDVTLSDLLADLLAKHLQGERMK